ncbi:uncharacterized protein LOC116166422 [Photinus pyralis]|uniref:uncharacterized protein LOC116166422 n=1 Tax=Photinus pyralis TaxID=7054 RepID=UPI0012677328|nr:uncharacterized protein LOC116166422 [Photinus pyralis]
MVMCFAPMYKHYSERDACNFFVFPSDPTELKRWLILIKRKDRDPGKHSRICNCHFVDGDRIGPHCTITIRESSLMQPKLPTNGRRIVDEGDDVAVVEEMEVINTPEQAVSQQFPAMLEAEKFVLKEKLETLKEGVKNVHIFVPTNSEK